MYYSININQIAIAIHNKAQETLKLDLIDGAIMEYLQKQTTSKFAKKNFIIKDNEIYYLLCYENIITQLPLLNIETKDAIGRRIKKLKESHIIKHFVDRQNNNKVYFNTTELFETFFSYDQTDLKPNPHGFKTESLTDLKPNQDNNINDNNINYTITTIEKQENCNTKELASQDCNTSKEYELQKQIITSYIKATFYAHENPIGCFSHIKNLICGGSLVNDKDNFTIEHIEENILEWGFRTEALNNAREIIEYCKLEDSEYTELDIYNVFLRIQSRRIKNQSAFIFSNFATNEKQLLLATLQASKIKKAEIVKENKDYKKIKKEMEAKIIQINTSISSLIRDVPDIVAQKPLNQVNDFHEKHIKELQKYIEENGKNIDYKNIALFKANDDSIEIHFYDVWIISLIIKPLIIKYFEQNNYHNIHFIRKFKQAESVNTQPIIPNKNIIAPYINDFLKDYDILLHQDIVKNELINMHIQFYGSNFAQKKGNEEAMAFLNLLQEKNERIGLNAFIKTMQSIIEVFAIEKKHLTPLEMYHTTIKHWNDFILFNNYL